MKGKKKFIAAALFVATIVVAGYTNAARQYHQEWGIFDAQGETIGYVTYPCVGPAIIEGDTNGIWVLEVQDDCGTKVKDP